MGESPDFDKIYVPDTSALVDEPDLIHDLINGHNLVCIPWMVHRELNSAKKHQNIAQRARRALKNINEYTRHKHPLLKLQNVNWEGIRNYSPANILERDTADDEIIATALSVYKEHEKEGKKVVLLTHDIGMQVKAREMRFDRKKRCLYAEEWNQDVGETADQLRMPTIEVEKSVIRGRDFKDGRIPVGLLSQAESLPDNNGALIKVADGEGSYISHVARRKADWLFLLPQDSKLLNVSQKPIKENGGYATNWEQILAINLLLDLDINYFAFIGDAGTGKTLLALASAFHFLVKGNRKFKTLYITRAPVPVGKTLGYLPGGVEEKMGEWLQGIQDNIDKVIELNPAYEKQIRLFTEGVGTGLKQDEKEGEDEKRKRVKILSYEHIRGRSLDDSVVVIDEGQNMPREEVITFATRLGENSRMIFTGDPSQIDDDFLTEQRNGLVWFAKLMKGDRVFAHVYFPETVRSGAVKALLKRLEAQK
jgi:PhoH-like ATPase